MLNIVRSEVPYKGRLTIRDVPEEVLIQYERAKHS